MEEASLEASDWAEETAELREEPAPLMAEEAWERAEEAALETSWAETLAVRRVRVRTEVGTFILVVL